MGSISPLLRVSPGGGSQKHQPPHIGPGDFESSLCSDSPAFATYLGRSVDPLWSADEEQGLERRIAMSDLVVIAFPTEAKAEEVC
jgi:hypothetical protein